MEEDVLPARAASGRERVEDLRERSDRLRARLAELTRDPDSGLRLLEGLAQLVGELRRLGQVAERSVWILQPTYFYDPEDPGLEVMSSVVSRGVQALLITRPATLATHPMLPSILPATRLAPVFLRAMVMDQRCALVEAPDSIEGERATWTTSRPDVVAAVLDVWKRTLPVSAPILPPGTEPPLSARQLAVARLLAVGEKDAAIARTLETSPRTVERDVRVILQELGARSRAEAVLVMRGRGVNGGRVAST